VGVAFHVVHHEHEAVVVVQVGHGPVQVAAQVRVARRRGPRRGDQLVVGVLEGAHPFAAAQVAQHHGRGDAVQPAAEGAVATEVAQAVEGADEGVLGGVLGQGGVAGHAVGQAVDPVHVRVVECALGGGVSGLDTGDEFGVAHGYLRLPVARARPCTPNDTACPRRVADAHLFFSGQL